MKKILFSWMVLSVGLISSALAEGTANLVTKSYVDSGLQYVYGKVQNTQSDVDELTVFVGAPSVGESPATGLTKRIEDLETGATGVNSFTGDGRGVIVTDDHKIGVIGLTQSTGTNNKVYVFKNNIATELEMADTWN